MIFNKSKKPVVIAIHGFGKRKSKEFFNLETQLKKLKIDFKTIDLFDEKVEDDAHWENWIAKAQDLIKTYSFDREIILIGFSMGGVIANYLSNINNVKKLVMIAPAFEYLNITTIINHIIKPKNKLPQKFTTQFSEVINNLKDYISDNKVPTLIIHCENDEVIPISSSIKYIEKINHENKILVTLSKGQHRILDDKIAGPIAINLIIDFIENKFLHLKSAD